MPGLQDTRRGILQTQINRCTSNVTPSSYVRRPLHVRTPLSRFVPRDYGCRPVREPHIAAPSRHHFIAMIAKQPFAGVQKNLVAVPMAVVVDTAKASGVKVVSSHISGDFRNLRRLSAYAASQICALIRSLSRPGNLAIHCLSTTVRTSSSHDCGRTNSTG
jgi:hypothetical protein